MAGRGADRLGLGSPDAFLLEFDEPMRTGTIAAMSRQSYRRSSFLDRRLETESKRFVRAPVGALIEAQEGGAWEERETHWVFHTALCGSTLLSRCLDLPGQSMAYREPRTLHQLSAEMRRRGGAGTARLLELAASLLGRTYLPEEKSVVKPSDSCNNLIVPVLQRSEASRAVLLYSPLEDFLSSVLGDKDRRLFVRSLESRGVLDGRGVGAMEAVDASALDDAHLAALVWVAQMRLYRDALAALGPRARTLEGRRLFEEPRETILQVAGLFGIGLSDRQATRIVRDGAVRRDSKTPGKAFDAEASRARRERTLAAHRAEIDAAMAWAEPLMDACGAAEALDPAHALGL